MSYYLLIGTVASRSTTMYDMYPQAWALDEGPLGAPERPRRRPRKEHSVLPAVVARSILAEGSRRSLS